MKYIRKKSAIKHKSDRKWFGKRPVGAKLKKPFPDNRAVFSLCKQFKCCFYGSGVLFHEAGESAVTNEEKALELAEKVLKKEKQRYIYHWEEAFF